MTTPSPALLASMKRGINLQSVLGGHGIIEAVDTWPVLKSKGFGHVRIACEMNHILPGVVPQASIDAAIARLDATVPALVGQGWAVSLCPFGDGPVANVDVIHRTLDFLAARYAPMGDVSHLAFELRNEPHLFSVDAWNEAIPDLIATIRGHAPDHTIVVPPVLHDSLEMLPHLVLPKDGNLIATGHFYEPAAATQMGWNGAPILPSYPFPAPAGTKGNTGLYTVAKTRARIKLIDDFGARSGVPVMVGEIGISPLAPEALRLAWAGVVVSAIEASPNILGWSWWDVNSLWGVRPWKHAGAWDQPLLDALTGAMGG